MQPLPVYDALAVQFHKLKSSILSILLCSVWHGVSYVVLLNF